MIARKFDNCAPVIRFRHHLYMSRGAQLGASVAELAAIKSPSAGAAQNYRPTDCGHNDDSKMSTTITSDHKTSNLTQF